MLHKTSALAIALSVGATLLPAVARADPPAAAEAQAAGARMRRIGWITAGGGAAVLVASGVMYGVAFKEREDLTKNYTHSESKAFERDLRTAKILTMVGLVAVGTGITLVLVAPKNENQVRVSAGLGEIAIAGTF